MHICCSGCALYPVRTILDEGVRMKALWYNPNIHPQEEYALRLDSVKRLQELWGLDVVYHDDYGLAEFNAAIESAGAGFAHGERCRVCYEMRMDFTAAEAARLCIPAFSTTLLVSPWQAHEMIADAGHRAAARHGVEFYYRDFRPGWQEGRKLLRGMDLYRQNYCGCIYSKTERLAERLAKSPMAKAKEIAQR